MTMASGRVLCVLSDEQAESYRDYFAGLRLPDIDFVVQPSAEDALDEIGRSGPRAVIVGMTIGAMEGLEFIATAMRRYGDYGGAFIVLPEREDPFPPMLQRRDPATGRSTTEQTNLQALGLLLSTLAEPKRASASPARPRPAAGRIAGADGPAQARARLSSARARAELVSAVHEAATLPPPPEAPTAPPPAGLFAEPASVPATAPVLVAPPTEVEAAFEVAGTGATEPADRAEPAPAEPARDGPAPAGLGLEDPPQAMPVEPEPAPAAAEPPAPSTAPFDGPVQVPSDAPIVAPQVVDARSPAPRGRRIAVAALALLLLLTVVGLSVWAVSGGDAGDASPAAGAPATGPAAEAAVGPGPGEPAEAPAAVGPGPGEPAEAPAAVAPTKAPPTAIDPGLREAEPSEPSLAGEEVVTLPLGFEPGEASHTVADRRALRRMLADALGRLRRDPAIQIEVGGHTSNEGDDRVNERLGLRRARRVRRELTDRGADPGRVVVRSYGASAPRVEGDSEPAREANRRVTLRVLTRRR